MRSSAGTHRVLERRAAALARPPATSHEEADVDVVVFTVAGGKRYALEVRYVRQVVRGEGLALLPASGSELVGIIPRQGEAVPVADLAAVLDLAAPDPHRPLVIVLAGEHPPIGLLVDDVLTATSLARAEIRWQSTPETAAVERGVTSEGVVVLDGAALLTDPRLRVTASVPETHIPSPAPVTERQP